MSDDFQELSSPQAICLGFFIAIRKAVGAEQPPPLHNFLRPKLLEPKSLGLGNARDAGGE
jgi:hypothetical protein